VLLPGFPVALLGIAGEEEIDTARLFDQIVVDKQRLRASVQRALRNRPQVTLRELLETEPLLHGLAELVGYLELAHAGAESGGAVDGLRALIDEAVMEPIRWQSRDAQEKAVVRETRVPRVIFTR
ncbi:MAG TPA: DUF3375 family protein, partial [Pseudomonadales bacterium]|nr:DUF3375 family protein [Pseudomonadales bacterium]